MFTNARCRSLHGMINGILLCSDIALDMQMMMSWYISCKKPKNVSNKNMINWKDLLLSNHSLLYKIKLDMIINYMNKKRVNKLENKLSMKLYLKKLDWPLQNLNSQR